MRERPGCWPIDLAPSWCRCAHLLGARTDRGVRDYLVAVLRRKHGQRTGGRRCGVAPSHVARRDILPTVDGLESEFMERRFLMGLRSFLIAGVVSALMAVVGTIAAEEQRRPPILIPGVQEPEEMRVEPFPTTKLDLTAPERMLGEALQKSDNNKPAMLLPALNQILAQYPDFSDGYVMRALALCDPGNDRAAITADLDRALSSKASLRTVSLLSTRAKMDYLSGNYLGAMNNLEKAIRSDLGKATEFTNSGAVKPEKTTVSVCVWTEPDTDVLVQRFPNDYRSHMFRGLYFSKFAPLDDDSLKPAIENLTKAAQLNPKSGLPQLFKAMLLGDHFVFYKRLNKFGWGDAERDKLDAEMVGEYSKALALDPNLLPALKGRAMRSLHLKQFEKAIADYDRFLSLDPQDWVAYHDRGLAKLRFGRSYDAICPTLAPRSNSTPKSTGVTRIAPMPT
jgi:tetratricopeptide (TPR) repeat protein